MANSAAVGLAIVVVIIIIVGVAYVALSGNKHATGSTTVPTSVSSTGGSTSTATTTQSTPTGTPMKRVPVLLTDPPAVPPGTQAVIMSYSSLKVYETSPSGSSWVNAQGNGSVDLLSVVNSSKVMGYVNVTANATISAVSFNVNSAYATINNTVYDVNAPSSVTVNIYSTSKVNSSTALLVDMSPAISADYNSNSTTLVMAPSAKATIVSNTALNGGTGIVNLGIGASVGLSASAMSAASASAPSITISSASASSTSSGSTLSLNVNDNSNSSVTLSGVYVYGPENVSTSANASTSGTIGIGGTLGVGGNVNVNVGIGANISKFQVASFSVSNAGSLDVASSGSSSSSVTVSPGSSTTLSFNGNINYSGYHAAFKPGTTYNVVVIGNAGVMAWTTFTAT